MLFQLEILSFLLSLFYIFYYFGEKLYIYIVEKREETINRKARRVERVNKQKIPPNSDNQKIKKYKRESIKPEVSEQIREILKRAEVNVERGYYESARALIIEGLALKKEDKDLNLLLADIYEREKKYEKAEYIYRDLIESLGDDIYILQRFGNIYVLRGKTKKSYEIYKRAHKLDPSNTEILDILAHITLEQKNHKEALNYANLFLKQKPRNIEKLGIKAYALEKLLRKKEAIEAYKEVLQLQPYNSEIQERIAILQS